MESLTEEVWGMDEVHLSNLSRLIPEMPSCPVLVKLFLQDNHALTMIPHGFFDNMPVLQVLDLSCTSIQCLPPSISKLVSLQEFILKNCSLLMELPPEIGALASLKKFDIEGTEMMYLPQDIGELKNLECLRVSLSAYAADYGERKGIETIIPRMMISKLIKLKELSISVSPEAEWWENEVSEAVLEELCVLPYLEALKLYLPTAKVLQRFLQLQGYIMPLYERLVNFKLIIGPYEQFTSTLPPHIEESFEKLDKCLKYINGEGTIGDVATIIRRAKSLFLCRHWTIEKLPVFDLDKLNYCLLSECNEMQNLIEDVDLRKRKVVLGSLQYLGVHCMMKLESIWRGPISKGCLSCLRILSLHSCPELTTVFSSTVLDNLGCLTELIVDDCAKITNLISLELGPLTRGPFLRSLKKLLLLDLPELVSISNGLWIALNLDTLLVFSCVKLSLVTTELQSGNIKQIKGEIEWWDALNCDKSNWNGIFVQLKRDGCLMDQLAEDTNSIQRFLELQKISPHPGGSSLKDHRSLSLDRHILPSLSNGFGFSNLSVQIPNSSNSTVLCGVTDENEDGTDGQSKEAGVKIKRMVSESPSSGTSLNEGSVHYLDDLHQKDTFLKEKHSRKSFEKWQIHVKAGEDFDYVNDDGFIWRKYGEKSIFGAKFPRRYYRCGLKGCMARKQVQRSDNDPSVFDITYKRNHTCNQVSKIQENPILKKTRDSSTATEPTSVITEEDLV